MSDKYKPQFILSSKVKALFLGPNGEKIRIAGDAKDKVMQYLDEKVKEGVQELIQKLPTKSKGAKKGELKRLTLQPDDFQ